MIKITEKQKKILGYIKNFISKNNFSPSVRDIAKHFNMSVKGAYDHLDALRRKEYIKNQWGIARSITILKEDV